LRYCKTILFLFVFSAGYTQTGFPLKNYIGADNSKPLILYFSGDGGWNSFSTKLSEELRSEGYTICSINSRAYFWEKKNATTVAAELTSLISNLLASRKNKHILFIGYSFGADILPFVLKECAPLVLANAEGLLLVSPSASTDFEIHVSELIGFNGKHNFMVAEAINQLSLKKIIAVTGTEEHDFPAQLVTQKNFSHIVLPGAHHFEGNTAELTSIIINNFSSKP
jgi:type IV secretory pathway VirJ component